MQQGGSECFLSPTHVKLLSYNCKENRRNLRPLRSFLSWGQVEWEGCEGLTSLGDRGDPLRETTDSYGFEDSTTWICTCSFTLKLMMSFCLSTSLTFLMAYQSWLRLPAHSQMQQSQEFSDVSGQGLKAKAVRVEVDVCLLGRECLTWKAASGTGKGYGKDVRSMWLSPGGPGKIWTGHKCGPPWVLGHKCVLVS